VIPARSDHTHQGVVGGAILDFGGTGGGDGTFVHPWDREDSFEGAENEQTKLTMPSAGTLKNGYARVTSAPGAGSTTTFTVRKNGVDTALVVSVVGAALTGADLVNTVAVVGGDVISMRENRIAGAANPGISSINFEKV
jgi:hypothetical protein